MKKTKIVVTGATGFIGRNLCRSLKDHYEVLAVCRGSSENSEFLKNENTHIAYYNLVESKNLTSVFSDAQYVIHLANTNKPASLESPIQENLLMVQNILAQLDFKSLKRFLYASSGGSIYGPSVKSPLTEDQPTLPITQYGKEKVLVENLIINTLESRGVGHAILRIANCYGPLQNYRSHHGFIPVALFRILNRLPIEIWGNGHQTKDYIYVDDVVDAFRNCLRSNENGIFNIGTGIGTALLDVIKLCEQVTQGKADLVFSDEKKWDIKLNVLSIEKAKKQIPWKPEVTLQMGIEKTYSWILSDLKGENSF